jgi:nuclear transport factor 2 (NTF2) superfamily protein
VRFAYEWHDDSGHWYRSYGDENWEFNDDGLMALRFASINDPHFGVRPQISLAARALSR